MFKEILKKSFQKAVLHVHLRDTVQFYLSYFQEKLTNKQKKFKNILWEKQKKKFGKATFSLSLLSEPTDSFGWATAGFHLQNSEHL